MLIFSLSLSLISYIPYAHVCLFSVLQEQTTSPSEAPYSVDYQFEEFFSGLGWFEGKVVKVVNEDTRLCEYEDGDVIELSVLQLDSISTEPKLGEVGFKFCRKWPRGGGVFNAEVVRVESNGKQISCKRKEVDYRKEEFFPKDISWDYFVPPNRR